MDMADFNDVIRVANEFTSDCQSLDILLNNAGLVCKTERKTHQGYRMTLAVNHLAHMLLIDELYQVVQAAQNSRIINVSSTGHKGFPGGLNEQQTKINIDDVFDDKEKYHMLNQYLKSKFANVLFTRGFARVVQKQPQGMKTVSLHPGIVGTNLARDGNCMEDCMMCVMGPLAMNEFEGAQNNIYTCCEDFNKLQNGLYYDGMKVGRMNPNSDSEHYQNQFYDKSIDLIESKIGRPLKNLKKFDSA